MDESLLENDATLLRRALMERDDAAFACIVRRYLPMVFSVAFRVTRNAALAEDVGQEVFLKLVRKPEAMARGVPLAAWLHRTARYQAIDLMRSENSRTIREKTSFLNEVPEDERLPDEALAILDEVIDKLPSADRGLVTERYLAGKSLKSMAVRCGLTEDAVRMRLNRALEKMRVLLARRGVTTTTALLAMSLPVQAVLSPPATLASSICSQASAAMPLSTFTKILCIMTTTQKYTVAAVSLVLAGTAGIVYTQSNKSPSAGTAALSTGSGKSASSTADGNETPEKVLSGRPARKGIPQDYADLASKYGEAKTRDAVALTSKLVPLTGEMRKMAPQGDWFRELSEEIGLREDQQDILKAVASKNEERAGRFQKILENHQRDVTELFLAADATKAGGMAPAEFDEVFERTRQQLMIGDEHVLDVVGLLLQEEKPPGWDLIKDPAIGPEILERLDAGQKEKLQELVGDFSPELIHRKGSEIFDLKDLDSYGRDLAGLAKMMDAYETMKGGNR